MNDRSGPDVGRRELLYALTTGAAIASVVPREAESVETKVTNGEDRKARYRTNSPAVQTFYRVNRYLKK